MLRSTKITFPGLFPNLELNVDSVAFTLFGHSFAWYALLQPALSCALFM